MMNIDCPKQLVTEGTDGQTHRVTRLLFELVQIVPPALTLNNILMRKQGLLVRKRNPENYAVNIAKTERNGRFALCSTFSAQTAQ